MRRTLEIHKSIKKIGIKVCLEVDDERDGHTTVRDSSTLGTLLVMLEDKNKKLLKAKVIKLTGQIVSLGGPKTIKKASRPRGGKQREDETNFKALVATLFGERPAHAAEGAWTAAASDIMRRQPDYLTKFHADRQLVEKVLGNGRFLVTPCTFLCPWESPCCPKGVCRLNRFGGISQMYKHWTAKHGDNPAAQQLIARFKVAHTARARQAQGGSRPVGKAGQRRQWRGREGEAAPPNSACNARRGAAQEGDLLLC